VIDEVIRIFEDGYKRIVEIRNKYDGMIAEEVDRHRCDDCVKRGGCNDEEREACMRDLDEKVFRLEVREADEEADVLNEIEDRVRELGFDVDLGFDRDRTCYFNAPGYPREFRYYNVYEYHRVIDTKNRKVYVIVAKTVELEKPWITEHVFDYIGIDGEYELIDEETRFTSTLVHNIPWDYIRPEWAGNINGFLNILARAEREGRLQEALREVLANVKADLWVYDYRHFYNALIETCRQLNVSLEG